MFFGPSTSWLELFIDQQEGYCGALEPLRCRLCIGEGPVLRSFS
jgi:hypothetical protein